MSHLRPALDPRAAEPLMGMRRSLRVAQVAEVLDMRESQVRQLVHDGQLEGHRAGKRSIRVYEDSVDEYRRRNHLGPKPKSAPQQRRKSGPSAAAREALASLARMGVFDR